MKVKIGLLMVGLMMVGLVVGGCGAVRYDEISYEFPGWTPEGLIYCQKVVTHYERKLGGLGIGYVTETLGVDHYYVTMDLNGNNETNLPYSRYPYFSPKGNYAALINSNKISIIRRSDNQVIFEYTPTNEGIAGLDWGPDEDRLIYVAGGKNLFSISYDGSDCRHIVNNCRNAIWANTNLIILEISSSEGVYLSSISKDGTDLKIFRYGYDPQITISNKILYAFGDEVRQIDYDGSNDNLIFSSFNKGPIRISPNNNYILGGAAYSSGYSGIWIINIDGSNIRQIK